MPNNWELWLDVHTSPVIAKCMAEYTGYIVKSAYTLNLYNMADKEIFQQAKDYGNVIIISKDADFPDLDKPTRFPTQIDKP
jgi:predicted nuclease of predicted toxin-antitoxin system